ncbi:MAG: response regulator, partial [Vicinamibacterales bacterium]
MTDTGLPTNAGDRLVESLGDVLRIPARREAPDVVLVDDDVALTEMLKFGLESAGHSVEIHDGGPEALAALIALPTNGAPRLVLLAIDLPGMDGYTLHEQLQAARPGRFVVVFLSVRDSDADQV